MLSTSFLIQKGGRIMFFFGYILPSSINPGGSFISEIGTVAKKIRGDIIGPFQIIIINVIIIVVLSKISKIVRILSGLSSQLVIVADIRVGRGLITLSR